MRDNDSATHDTDLSCSFTYGSGEDAFGQACSPGVGEWNLTGHKTAYVPSCCKRDWAKVMNLVIE